MVVIKYTKSEKPPTPPWKAGKNFIIILFLLFFQSVAYSDETSNIYDDLGRLTRVIYKDGYEIIQVDYDYDAVGNSVLKEASIRVQDTDGDGMPDAWEIQYGFDPDVDDAGLDSDTDGLLNLEEYVRETDPTLTDTDSDGVSDGDEVAAGTDPNDPDSRP